MLYEQIYDMQNECEEHSFSVFSDKCILFLILFFVFLIFDLAIFLPCFSEFLRVTLNNSSAGTTCPYRSLNFRPFFKRICVVALIGWLTWMFALTLELPMINFYFLSELYTRLWQKEIKAESRAIHLIIYQKLLFFPSRQ